ncbi:MAG: hypothetical protein LBP65_01830 [Puniceicoccales bacterium]|jgi:hypothetical protein|nr:hypothetical protein [Puniceicoccales bacterium]
MGRGDPRLLEKLARLVNDPVLWMESFLQVRGKDGAVIPFRLNKFQKKLAEEVVRELAEMGRAFFVILKGRQLGVSTVCRGLAIWRALNFPGQQCVAAAHEEGLVRQNMVLIREMLEGMDRTNLPYASPTVISDSRIFWKSSGSAIMPRLPAGKSEGRGLPVHFLHCTEVDFFDSIQAGCWSRFLGGILPALPRSGAIFIVESTCQGRGALYDLYLQSLSPQSDWQHLFFPWFEEDQYRSPVDQELTEQEVALREKYGLDRQQMNFWAAYARQCGTVNALREYPFCIEDAFTVAGTRGLIPHALVEEAMRRQLAPDQEKEPLILGIDPSRLRDATGLALRQGKNILFVEEIPPLGDVAELAQHVSARVQEWQPALLNCDSGGMGGPFIDVLRRILKKFVTAVDFGSRAEEERKFFNRRSELYGTLRKWLVEGGKLPYHAGLARELAAIEVNQRREGRLLLEPKHSMARSPNLADACALTMTVDNYLSRSALHRSFPIKPCHGIRL